MSGWFAFAWANLPALLHGTGYTLAIWAVAMIGGFIAGWILAVARVYGDPVSRALATGYIELIRGTPLLVQMFIVYQGLPQVGIVFAPLTAAMVAIGINTAAYQAEYFRAGIRAVRPGQLAAGRAIGLTRMQTIGHIVLPQAWRIALPQWSNEVIIELKYTSVAFAISVPELMGQAKMIGADSFKYFQIFLVAALIYLVLVSAITLVLDQVERRYALRQ
ncbi:amino acid ABC transporter permease [Salinisphaera sp. RV14]|uniref:amino acid ABC transporter permease n=1 Tax=unclassified Salinisphaera TaxID=2649847 RepID=UPI000D705D80|nr:amino acid ABC transporter permease [Salinisphaera sp. LB1]AWN15234.1 Amino acid ABC transporter, permease protein [Salinisphaera sp. LB1]